MNEIQKAIVNSFPQVSWSSYRYPDLGPQILFETSGHYLITFAIGETGKLLVIMEGVPIEEYMEVCNLDIMQKIKYKLKTLKNFI